MNVETLLQDWLKAIHPSFQLIDGSCHLKDEHGNDISIFLPNGSHVLTLMAVIFPLTSSDNDDLFRYLLELNSDSDQLKGCWLGLQEGNIVLSRCQNMNDLDEISFNNLFENFLSLTASMRNMLSQSSLMFQSNPKINQTHPSHNSFLQV